MHTDLTACNTALDKERDTRKRYADYLAHQILELRREAQSKLDEASGLQIALATLNQMHGA